MTAAASAAGSEALEVRDENSAAHRDRQLKAGMPALVAALAAAALAGGGQAAAAAHPGSTAAHPGGPAAPGASLTGTAGIISTVAGGVGGPAKATKVALDPCGVAFGAGRLYVADTGSVRRVNPGTDWLTTPAGTGINLGPVANGGSPAKPSMLTCGGGGRPLGQPADR